jgi:hypothetical protein
VEEGSLGIFATCAVRMVLKLGAKSMIAKVVVEFVGSSRDGEAKEGQS